MWTSVVSWLNSFFHSALTNYFTTTIMTALGLTGWFYMWITKTTINEIWDRVIDPMLKVVAAFWDMKNTEDKNLKKYKDDVEKGDLDKMAKDGENLLNGKK